MWQILCNIHLERYVIPSIKLDLTKRRYEVLRDAFDLVKEHPDLD